MNTVKKKAIAPETVYGLLKDGTLKVGFLKGLKVEGVKPDEINIAEKIMFKFAKQLDQKTFCETMKNGTIDKIAIKLNSKELASLKGGFWGLWGSILGGAMDWGFSVNSFGSSGGACYSKYMM